MLWWILQQLKSSNAETRAKAARKLGAAKQRKAVPFLIRNLEDENRQVRQAVADALGEIAHSSSAEPLASTLADLPGKLKSGLPDADYGSETVEYETLAKALAKMGPSAVTPLLRVLETCDKEPRRWSAFALGLIGDPQAVDPLIRKLGDSRSEVRKAAALALAEIGDARAVKPLIGALSHRDLETRRAAAEALGSLGAGDATDALVNAVADQSEMVQLPAMHALAKIGGLRAASCLRSAMGGPRKAISEAAEKALFSMKWTPANPEEQAEFDVIRGDFGAAARAGAAAVPALTKALGFRDPQMRTRAAETLGSIRSASAVPQLLKSAADHDPAAQKAAVQALVNIGDASREGLESLLASYDASVACLAAEALGKIADPRSAPALLDLIAANCAIPDEYPEFLEAVRAAAGSLDLILRSFPEKMLQRDLTRIAELPEVIRAPGNRPSAPVDCAPLRNRAAEELLHLSG